MDEIDFLRGVEGESQNGEDLVMGAEHLVRLKKQVGLTRPSDANLELEKEAGFVDQAGQFAAGAIRPFVRTADRVIGAVGDTGRRAGHLGELAAGAGAVGGAYALGRQGKEKEAGATLQDVLRDARIKTAATHNSLPFSSQASSKYQAAKGSIKNYLSRHPTARAATIAGAAAGGVNAALGAANSPGDRVGGAVRGGITGAALGAGGGALYHHLSTKLAEMRMKTANSVLERLKDVNPGLVAATGIGALAGGLGTYLASRPQKDSGKSKAEEELGGQVEAQRSQPERGLLSKMHHRNTELEHGYARAFREHPVGAAAIGTATGALGGYGIGRLAGAAARMRGGK